MLDQSTECKIGIGPPGRGGEWGVELMDEAKPISPSFQAPRPPFLHTPPPPPQQIYIQHCRFCYQIYFIPTQKILISPYFNSN
jgi:hypothetical protein